MSKRVVDWIAGLPDHRSGLWREPTVEATVLRFTDIEPQGEPTPVRMIITPEYLRIDDGTDAKPSCSSRAGTV